MEIEFEKFDLQFAGGAGVIIILVLLLIVGYIGKANTPEGDQVLTWQELSIRKVQARYREELSGQQIAIAKMIDLMKKEADPARTQVVTEEVIKQNSNGIPALDPQRQALISAAYAVKAWSLGQLDIDETKITLQAAANSIKEAEANASKFITD